MGYTYEQLQAMGAKPATPVATSTPKRKYTSAELKAMGAKPVPVIKTPAEPTLMQKLGKRYNTAVEGQSYNPIRNNVRIAGGIAGGINDVLGAVINPVFNATTNAIGSIPAVQKFAMAKPVSNTLDAVNTGIQKVSDTGTRAMSALPTKTQQDLRDAGNIVSLLPIGKGAQITAKVAEPVIKPVLTGAKNVVVKTPDAIASKRATEILNIENNYANTRKANLYSKDAGAESRKRVAYTDVLVDAVDENGLLRTKQPGGAYEKYKKETIDGREGVVRTLLEKEGKTVNLADVEAKLNKSIYASNLEGADLRNALNNVKKDIAGYRLKADKNGNVPLTLIHDAKISTTQGINFLTEPNVKLSKKSTAKGLKELIEENSAENVKEINGELTKYYNDLDLIERLDGKRVKGGKLGKFTSQVGGGIVGTAVGATVGGPIGAAVGGYVGSQLAEKIKGRALSKTLGKNTGLTAPESQILKDAYSRSVKDSTILNTKNPNIPAPIIDISPTLPPIPKKSTVLPVNRKLEAYRSGKPSLEGGYIKNPLAKTPEPLPKGNQVVSSDNLITEAKKYKSAEDYIQAVMGGKTQYGDYNPKLRSSVPAGYTNITELGVHPDEMVTVYRGIDDVSGKVKRSINDGDFVTTDFDSALSYTGNPKNVVEMQVPAKTLYNSEPRDFKDEPFYTGAEYIYTKGKTNNLPSRNELTDIYNKANAKPASGLPKSIPEATKRKVAFELENYDSTPLKVNGKIDLSNSDIEFRLDQLKDKNANGTFTNADAIEAQALLKKMGIDIK